MLWIVKEKDLQPKILQLVKFSIKLESRIQKF
jgi:hypothetical protein